MQLSERLSAVASLVTEGSRLADVGTDHGYVPIWLIQEGKIPSAIAMDVNRGPLMRAREHIRSQGLEGYIETRLSDGLAALEPGEADCVLIAGMGGALTVRILDRGRDKWKGIREWVLQPQSEIDEVRRFLAREGFSVREEAMVKEDGKYYPMMRAVPGASDYRRESEFLFGKQLLEQRNAVLWEYLLREKQKYGQVLERLSVQNGEAAQRRIPQIRRYLEAVQEAMSEYEV